jgi:hypothetical protein
MPFTTLARTFAVALVAAPLAVACSSSSGDTTPGVDAGHDSSHVTSRPDSGKEDASKRHDSGAEVCAPGSTMSCQCASSTVTGTHSCLTDGSGYGPCLDCAPHEDAGATDSGTDSGGPTKDSGSNDANIGDAPAGDGSLDGGLTCRQTCAESNMAAYQSFLGDILASCGCATGAACATTCTSECANPSTLTQASPCGMCIQTQVSMGASSTCLVSAATTCGQSPTCEPFVVCAEACP